MSDDLKAEFRGSLDQTAKAFVSQMTPGEREAVLKLADHLAAWVRRHLEPLGEPNMPGAICLMVAAMQLLKDDADDERTPLNAVLRAAGRAKDGAA
jgi:hypothetical protein